MPFDESILRMEYFNQMKAQAIPAPFLNTAQVASWLGIEVCTIRKWVCYEKIPFLKIGRRVLFKKEDIEAWLTLENPNYEKWKAMISGVTATSYNADVR